MSTIVCDLGGTFLRCAVADAAGTLTNVERWRLADREGIWEQIIERICTFAVGVHSHCDPADPIVISFPGPVRARWFPVCAPTVSAMEPPPLDFVEKVRSRSGRSVSLINDVSAAAWRIGEMLDADRCFIVTVSSGIGSKLYDRVRGVFDDEPYGGEIGHVVVDSSPTAPSCGCGGRGHLGAISSGAATELLARQRAQSDAEAFRRSICARVFGASPESLNNEMHLVPAALAGDVWAWDVIREAMTPLASVLTIAAHVTGAQQVVIIGGFASALGERYADELRGLVRAHASPPVFGFDAGAAIVLWNVGENACLEGAAAFGRTRALVT